MHFPGAQPGLGAYFVKLFHKSIPGIILTRKIQLNFSLRGAQVRFARPGESSYFT